MGPERSIKREINFSKPDIRLIHKNGLVPVDMHFHTTHSDAITSIPQLLKTCNKRETGVAITDHNAISGVIEATRLPHKGLLIVPGIEISAWDGPHILLYFYDTEDLSLFFREHVRDSVLGSPYLATSLTTEAVIKVSEDFDCIISAAHPYGYLFLNKGVLKCFEKGYLEESLIRKFDAFEVLSAGLPRNDNIRAYNDALKYDLGITGGSDGHAPWELGTVVTTGQAGDLDDFLNSIKEKATSVTGTEMNALGKLALLGVALPKHMRYFLPSMKIHYLQNKPRLIHTLNKYRKRE